ncbi:MAG: A/G-specific adenine glycosylase [Actinomycetota bacterium]
MTGAAVSDALRAWYRPRRRAYPWRGSGDPYAVLVSEVMLQQTQAARAVPVFERFLARFPTVEALASAPRSEVVRAWAGLGYNRRAVALSEAAREIERAHGGRIPGDPEVLRTLPGVGPYTAAAVASFAFGAPSPPSTRTCDASSRGRGSAVTLTTSPSARSPRPRTHGSTAPIPVRGTRDSWIWAARSVVRSRGVTRARSRRAAASSPTA